MADSKKYNGSTWEHSLRKLGTATDVITSFPADLYADGNNATVGLVGNMVQTGTPTPQNPITPSECGERTENLFDKDNTTLYNAYINAESKWFIVTDVSKSIKIPVSSNTQYTLSVSEPNALFRIYETNIDDPEPSEMGTLLSEIVRGTNINQYTFTTASDTKFIVFQGSGSTVNEWLNSLMLNTGSEALPYEPYGYKIPILSANTTTPVYLGEVESTRKIKKLVLTGEESDWSMVESYTYFRLPNFADGIVGQVVCSHYVSPPDNISIFNTVQGIRIQDSSSYGRLLIVRPPNFMTETLSGFKTYLQQQYAAGTPVCVWYVLANEETGIVNEPIRKIGDYADTVSGITIPTITGKDTFDVQTTLKPSEVSLAYTGWHDATVEEWDGSEWDGSEWQ